MKREMDDREMDALVERVTRALDVPEPSPLFWERFPERVRAATQAEAPLPAPAWWRRHGLALSLSGALCAALAVWAVVPAPAPEPAAVIATDAAPVIDDAGWSVVSASAETAGVDALREAGFTVRPGGADAVIDELTQAERAAFAALLELEMKGAGTKGDGPDGL
jgi:hypothetical protein